MTEKWTKGPWVTRGLRVWEDQFRFNARKGLVAEVTISWRSSEEANANAHLIASAPNLAETLDTAPERPDMEADKYEIDRWFQEYRDWLTEVDAALAKARGETS